MTISVVPGSVSFELTQRPSVLIDYAAPDALMSFLSTPITFNGACRLQGTSGDNTDGWILGCIQLQWIETNWGHYRGALNTDGSLFFPDVYYRRNAPCRLAATRSTQVPSSMTLPTSPARTRPCCVKVTLCLPR